MNGVQTRFKCKLDVKRCKRFVFPPSSLLPRSNALKTKAIRYFQTDRTLTRIVSPPLVFNKAVFVDRHNQNIASLERSGKGQWVVRSMNPSTTGRHLPPYAQETPLGMFVLQEKKVKMVFLKDGSKETGGYAPYASRFTDGAYIHGVPVNAPRKTQIEYSPSLGTTPRSHMCVRNATSHAKFIYDWAPVNETIIFVLE